MAKSNNSIAETSWVENKLAFEDESFKELALKMERWYGVSIQFTDENIAALRFTGVFEDETINDAMRALTITASFTYKVQGKTITISR
ncbi:DUF4974 domain-containing protein [Paraflavitalea speifideaquila]|uniref:DUF4974 domain-containing protein n=1 Tax=Paraflavitalea speifideaquila TaxID=3076558 RepID=UPI0028F0B8AF|nr:DUF4974 domain-containing protein [Paraflavitalea speifideiaquila]